MSTANKIIIFLAFVTYASATLRASEPYYASIEENDRHNCGGALIGNRYILTSAYCVSSQYPMNPNDAAEFRHPVMTVSIAAGGVHAKFNVLRIFRHPGYQPGGQPTKNDFAIITLSRRVTDVVRSAKPLQPGNLYSVSSVVKITSFGQSANTATGCRPYSYVGLYNQVCIDSVNVEPGSLMVSQDYSKILGIASGSGTLPSMNRARIPSIFNKVSDFLEMLVNELEDPSFHDSRFPYSIRVYQL